MNIRVMNENDKKKEIKLGFSWTALFFGFFVTLVRGDLKGFLILLSIEVFLALVGLTTFLPVIMLGFSFFYNKLYAKDLYDKGYRGVTPEEDRELVKYIQD